MAAFESKTKNCLITHVYPKKLAHLAISIFFQFAVFIFHNKQSTSIEIYAFNVNPTLGVDFIKSFKVAFETSKNLGFYHFNV